MRPSCLLGLAAATLVAMTEPLTAQGAGGDSATWKLAGLRSSFCIQALLDPASDVLRELPKGYQAVRASAASDLHVSLRSVIEGQPEFADWIPSRLCFIAADTVRTRDFNLVDRSGRHPHLIALWTVPAAGPSGGTPQDVALGFFANSERLARSARLAGQGVREARLTVGKVPAEDINGMRSTDDRFQVKLGKTTITWDGRLASESTAVHTPVRSSWTMAGVRGGEVQGVIELQPAVSHPMAGSLKVDGKDAFAKALRASPTRFAGPAYRGGGGKVAFIR